MLYISSYYKIVNDTTTISIDTRKPTDIWKGTTSAIHTVTRVGLAKLN